MIQRTALLSAVIFLTVIPWASKYSFAEPGSPRSFSEADYSGGDGLSKAAAVVLKIASDAAGIASEYAWVAHTYPGSKVLTQALSTWDHGKRYDVLTVQTAEGSKVSLWFDISVMYK
jgi:hypothetical protein